MSYFPRLPLGDAINRANQLPEPAWLTVDKLLEPPPSRTGKKPGPKPKAGSKRKAEEAFAGQFAKLTCNQVRGKIRRLLESGEIKKGEFCEAIGVSGNALNRFLAHTGSMEGFGCHAYYNSIEYFEERERAGVKMPTKKAKPSTAAVAGSSSTAAATAAVTDIRGISLSGEASDAVPVYDSCDEIRRKINAHLIKPGVTQAQFCRELEAQKHTEVRKIQSKQLTDFRSKSGPSAGNTSIVYYTAYVYFEKLRLAEGRDKSKHRCEMEGIWPSGMETDRLRNRFIGPSNADPVEDRYGRISWAWR